MKLTGRIVHVDGNVVGFQFAKRSMGSRIFKKRTVEIDDRGNATAYIPVMQRSVRVRRLHPEYSWHWEAF